MSNFKLRFFFSFPCFAFQAFQDSQFSRLSLVLFFFFKEIYGQTVVQKNVFKRLFY